MSFPLNSNQAYIKDTGERTTLGAIVGSGGGSDLPEYSAADAGKVLTVDVSGALTWSTPVNRTPSPIREYTPVFQVSINKKEVTT